MECDPMTQLAMTHRFDYARGQYVGRVAPENSAIRNYLAGVDRSALLRSRETHPAILALVRAFEAGGGFCDEDAERYVENAVGDLPPHRHHGHPERDPMTYALGAAIYNARHVLDDERAKAKVAALIAQGYEPITEQATTTRYRRVVLYPTRHIGGSWAEYQDARLVSDGRGGVGYVLPKGHRTRGHYVSGRAVLALR